jgi:hypothetical protein
MQIIFFNYFPTTNQKNRQVQVKNDIVIENDNHMSPSCQYEDAKVYKKQGHGTTCGGKCRQS